MSFPGGGATGVGTAGGNTPARPAPAAPQPSLFNELAEPPCDRIEAAFREFHAENPHVYTQLVELARQLKCSGRKRYGMKGLFEVLRWQRAIRTSGDDFILNNNYTAYYSRLIMTQEPDLEGFFELRVVRGERAR